MKNIGNILGLLLVSAGAWIVAVGMDLITDKDIQHKILASVRETAAKYG
jgi:hypothetical protein